MSTSTTNAPGRAKRPLPATKFLAYQKAWIEDDSRLKLMEKSRQVGISWSTAYRALRQASRQGAAWDYWVSSRDEVQARLFLEDIRKFAEVLQIAVQDLGERVFDEGGKAFQAHVLHLSNGRRVHSMSSNPDA